MHVAPRSDGPPNDEEVAYSRRQFFNRALIQTSGFAAVAFATSVVGFVWPRRVSGGFGGMVHAGSASAIRTELQQSKAPVYLAEARAYVSSFPSTALESARRIYPKAVMPLLEQGLIVQSQTCPHLGCRVQWCAPSQWFECPCHGSKYNRAGEKKQGPAPRGMTLVYATIENDELRIDSANRILGVPVGTDTTGQLQEGPLCFST